MSLKTRMAATRLDDEVKAVEEIARSIDQPDVRLVLLFCSARYDLDRLGAALRAAVPYPLLACTTAGELSSMVGYSEGGIVACSVASPELRAHVRSIPSLRDLDAGRADALVAELMACRTLPKSNAFGLMLLDGLAMLEEQAAAAIYSRFEGIPLVGGSAGDDQRLEKTHVWADGAFRSPAGAVCLVETTLPFRTFKLQHHAPAPVKLVITEADPSRRRVSEIDGMPAAEAYALAVGVPVERLCAAVFAAHPVMLRIGEEYYIRSIQRVEPGGDLVFHCAIDRGLVLTLGQGCDPVGTFKGQLEALRAEVGDIGLLIGCSCVFRLIELQESGLVNEMARVMEGCPAIGFSTYGESFNGIHVNQTLTGVALGVSGR